MLNWIKNRIGYHIVDNRGTHKVTWTFAQASQWISACGPVVAIGRRGRVLAYRVQRRCAP